MGRKKKEKDDEEVGGRENVDKTGRRPKFRGGSKAKRDKHFGIDDPWFWRWWHRVKKPELDGVDGSAEDVRDAYDEWISKNRPEVN